MQQETLLWAQMFVVSWFSHVGHSVRAAFSNVTAGLTPSIRVGTTVNGVGGTVGAATVPGFLTLYLSNVGDAAYRHPLPPPLKADVRPLSCHNNVREFGQAAQSLPLDY